MAEKHRRRIGQWRCATVTLILVCAVLIITVMSIAIIKNRHLEERWAPPCGKGDSVINLSEPDRPSVFHDLTTSELIAIRQYLQSATGVNDLNLVDADKSAIDKSFIFTADLFLAAKTKILLHLEMDVERPVREARVIVFRGDLKPPVIQEYIVGPLPEPQYHYLLKSANRKNPVPDAYKPYSIAEFDAVIGKFLKDVNWQLARILTESYDATFLDCENKCLKLIPVPISPDLGRSSSRRLLYQAVYDVEYHALFPVDIMFLFVLNGTDASSFYLEKIIYADQSFYSIKDLQHSYIEGSIHKTAKHFPMPDSRTFTNFGEGADWHGGKRRPRMVEPDGKRYSINHREVRYMNWKFDFRLSPLSGPMLHDVHFGEERIAYEISLQEIAAYYSSSAIGAKVVNFVHGSMLLGTQAKSLIPGTDCPETATFVKNSFLAEKSNDPFTAQRSMCIFELNSGTPIRRHLSYALEDGGFYDGMVDSSLVVRTILSVANHDYIIDYIFHQNGVLETKVTPAGYVHGLFYSNRQERFGYQLRQHLAGPIHQQLFNFKVDLDVFGTSNRYQTLAIHSKKVANRGEPYSQIMYKYDLKQTELEAGFTTDSDIPIYHLFYNNRKKTEFHVPRAIRVEVQGSSKNLLEENPLPWSSYQLAVTKYKAEEVTSSSPYAAFDSVDPVVNFTQFVADNDKLIDTDLVLWITMGLYEIPHSEELPLASTIGKQLSFFLKPFNFFLEDPSLLSRDAVRAVHNDTRNLKAGVRFVTDDTLPTQRCIMTELNLTSIADKADSFLLSKRNRTLL